MLNLLRKSVNKKDLGSVSRYFSQTCSFRNQTVENNLKTETNRLSKTLTKFWEKVDTAEKDGKFVVQLDGKPLRTPAGFPLAVPVQKQLLADLVAHEWTNLPDLKIKTNSLPITSLVARAVDLETITRAQNKEIEVANMEELTVKIGNLEDIRINMLRYLDTDTCLIMATNKEYEGKLRERQNELYHPLRKEYESFFTAWGNKRKLCEENIQIEYLDCQEHGLRGNRQTILTQSIALDWLEQLNMWELVALEKAILTSKSFLCGVTLLRSSCQDEQRMKDIFQVNKSSPAEYYFKTIDEIVELGNLETIFQTAEWGEVEDTHDVDKVDWLRNLTSASLLNH